MKILFAATRAHKGQGLDPSFTLGNTYLVLGVHFEGKNCSAMVSIQRDDDGTPVLAELCYFSILDSAIPPDWHFFDFGDGFYALQPKEFGGDFWDRFHDADLEAEKTFEQAVKKLEAFHAQTVPPADK
jgi:hypothetical protein